MLSVFAKTKNIDASQLSKMDLMIKQSERDQIRVLNKPLPLTTQRIMFGAFRNINTSVKVMKEKLKTASLKHENPTTAERALELMDILSTLTYYVDPFVNRGEIAVNPDEIAKASRMLYRKARSFGFSENRETQLREAGVTEGQEKSFINDFENNVSQQLGIEEEVKNQI
jgi:hypothetical protein